MRPDIAVSVPIPELPESFWLAIARGGGALLGSAISIVYVLPKSRREAAIRFIVGVLFGVLFGPLTGVWLMERLALGEMLQPFEIFITGSAAASLCAWWGLGLLRRMFESRPRQNPAETPRA